MLFFCVTSSFPEKEKKKKTFEELRETTTEKLLEPLSTLSHLGFINVCFKKELSCLHLLVEQKTKKNPRADYEILKSPDLCSLPS